MRELRAQFCQTHLAGNDLVAASATELFEACGFLALLRRALIRGHLSDQVHCGQHGNAPLEALRRSLSLFRESELAALAQGMTTLAAVGIEDVSSQFLLVLAGGDHSVENGG